MNTVSRNETLELLPWYENGTLDATEAEAVRELLATDLDANRQARELRALRAALADEPILATNMSMNLRRLHARIDPEPRRRPAWVMPTWFAAAASLLVVAGLGLFMAGERSANYVLLTKPQAVPAVPADYVLYRVDVADGVDAAALAALAGIPEARILQAPSAHGVALLAVPDASSAEVLARLRADPRLRFVTVVPR